MKKMLGVILPLLIVTGIIFSPSLINPKLLLERGNDLQGQFWPIRYFVKQNIIINHQLPLWNNAILSGTPLLPDPQAPIFYPPNLIFLVLPIDKAFIASFLLHTFLAGIFFYCCLKTGFGFSHQTSLFGAIFYLTSPKLAGYLEAGHVGLVYSWTWIPLIVLAVKQIAIQAKLKWSIILAIGLAGTFYTHVLIFAISFISATIFFIYSTLNNLKTKIGNYKYLIYSLIITFGLIAVSLLPQLEWQNQTTRYLLLNIRDVYPKWSSKLEFIRAVITPWLGNNIWKFDSEKWLAIGIFPSILAIFGFTKLRKSHKYTLIAAGVFITLISLNNASPIYNFLLKQDWYVLFRVSTRSWFLVVTVFILLATYWFEKTKSPIKYLLIILAITESLFLSWKRLQKPYFKADYAPKEVYEFLGRDKARFRVFCTTRCLSQKESAIYNLELIDGYNTLIQKNYYTHSWQLTGTYWNYYSLSVPPIGAYSLEKLQPQAKPLGEYNTKYVISPHPLKDKNFQLVKTVDEYLIYLNKVNQPRSPAPIEIYTPNHIRVNTQNLNRESLVISEVYSPGWKAYLNGKKEVPVQETPIHQRLVNIDPDTKFVDFYYQPMTYKWGKIITFLTLLIISLSRLFKHFHRKTTSLKKILAFLTR